MPAINWKQYWTFFFVVLGVLSLIPDPNFPYLANILTTIASWSAAAAIWNYKPRAPKPQKTVIEWHNVENSSNGETKQKQAQEYSSLIVPTKNEKAREFGRRDWIIALSVGSLGLIVFLALLVLMPLLFK
jgi:hypothetical protein